MNGKDFDEDRKKFIKDNAAVIVEELYARIEKYKKIITKLEKSRRDMRFHMKQLRKGKEA